MTFTVSFSSHSHEVIPIPIPMIVTYSHSHFFPDTSVHSSHSHIYYFEITKAEKCRLNY